MTEKGKKLLEATKNGGCAVVGMGVSNVPLAEFLISLGGCVTLRDAKERDKLSPKIAELENAGGMLVCGADYLSGLDESVIFRAPGLRPDIAEFAEAERNGAIISCESELFMELCPAFTVGITGSDGKTTTTTLTHLLISEALKLEKAEGRAYIGGNIGIPLIPLTRELRERDIAVCELSSFQLQRAERSADVAVITNLSPNHLNWHTDMDEYVRAKTNIYRHSECRMLITNAENAICAELAEALSASNEVSANRSFATLENGGLRTASEGACARTRVTLFSSDKRPDKGDDRIWLDSGIIYYEAEGKAPFALFDEKDILLPGKHNRENYMAACAAAIACGFAPEAVKAAMETVAPVFGGVEHRLELVREKDGVRYYNSSIDSSPTRTAAALSTFKDKNSILICGGSDKNIPFAPLAENLNLKAKAVVLTGEAGPKIDAALSACPLTEKSGLIIIREPNFDKAVYAASALAKEGDRVILSPACASFDAFPNFEVRGRHFKELIRKL
ncbi:MAG: UDP-N-acetylmuramoyl-L-alanine--D-glutamate ligase [Clostridia bacterium]|nr:UDP-N-acetylmuramoyl-L-alanine--D-glutamate ligase [Clostridia bacterium]